MIKQKNERGITLIAFAIIIVLVLLLAFTAIYFIFYKSDEGTLISDKIDKIETEDLKIKEKIEEKIYDARIVSDLIENEVAIPKGYSYVQGDIKTGIIIKSNDTEAKYLFIPNNEQATQQEADYYKKINNYIPMDSSVQLGIEKYNGFFVELSSKYKKDDLKTIDNNNYEIQSYQLQYTYENYDSINAHILYKEELAMIDYYLNNNNIELGENTIGIQALTIEPFSHVNEGELIFENDIQIQGVVNTTNEGAKITKATSINTNNLPIAKTANNSSSKSSYVYYYETSSQLYGGTKSKKVGIPIPSGFKYCETADKVIMIQDDNNKNLIYIWVPLLKDEINTKSSNYIKKQLWNNLYKRTGIDYDTEGNLYKMITNSEEDSEEYKEFKNSIEDYGGFYISQAELSYDGTKERLYNLERGMIESSATNTLVGGDYFRLSNKDSSSYEKIKSIANNSNKNDSVNSHLIYGEEYDATLVWIAETNSDAKLLDLNKSGVVNIDTNSKDNLDIYNLLCVDSTHVGKYKDSGLGANSASTDITKFNGIWGLGGNLSELAQEKYNNKYILRGGSYLDSGSGKPIASRISKKSLSDFEKDEKQSVGFRTALYIEPGLKPGTKESSFEYNNTLNDIYYTHNGSKIGFELIGERVRYVAKLDGTKIYEKPDTTSKHIEYNMAQEVIVDAKATKVIQLTDGTEMEWARVKINENNYGYINAKDLTKSATLLGNNIYFVLTQNGVDRYHKDSIKIYSEPNDEKVLWDTAYAGKLNIIGKSTDQKWAVYKEGKEYRYVHANVLSKSATFETINDITFMEGVDKKFYIIEANAKIYSDPIKTNEIKSLKFGSEVTAKAISIDGTLYKVISDSTTGYIPYNFISTVKPSEEQTAENGAKFTETNDYVWVKNDGVRIRTSCDTSITDNIIEKVNKGTKVYRYAHGDKGWDKIKASNGETGYIWNEYLSTTEIKPTQQPDGDLIQGEVTWEFTYDTVYTNGTDINVRSSATKSSKAVGVIKDKGTQLKRIAKGSNEWSKVEYDGSERYIESEYLVTENPNYKQGKVTINIDFSLEEKYKPRLSWKFDVAKGGYGDVEFKTWAWEFSKSSALIGSNKWYERWNNGSNKNIGSYTGGWGYDDDYRHLVLQVEGRLKGTDKWYTICMPVSYSYYGGIAADIGEYWVQERYFGPDAINKHIKKDLKWSFAPLDTPGFTNSTGYDVEIKSNGKTIN